MATFKEMLKASMKSKDTEEWLDVYFTRPIGLVFTLLWKRLGVHPTVITILGMILGAAAGWMFWHSELEYNIWGVVLMMLSNFCDSTDGQLARLTGKKTLVGRVLDGFSADVTFFCVYFALSMRMMTELIPGTDVTWGPWIWVMAFMAGIMSHSPQCLLSDYYRQIHLFFQKGKEGSELDKSEEQWRIFREQPKKALFFRAFYYNYAKYCATQERRTKNFQLMMAEATNRYGAPLNLPAALKEEFLAGSRPLMKYTNLLTFNMRAIALYIACLIDLPWLYLLFEIVVMNIMYIYMHHEHENLCHKMVQRIVASSEAKATKENENKEESDENKESEDCHNTDFKED